MDMDAPRLPDHTPLRTAMRRLRCQRGMSLVELLVVMPMMAVVLLSIYGLNNIGVKGQNRTNDRVTSMLRHQNGLERITREMRQAVDFTPVSSQILDAETYVRPTSGGASVLRRVRYECQNSKCVRYEGPVRRLSHHRARDRDFRRAKRGRLLLRAGQREPEPASP